MTGTAALDLTIRNDLAEIGRLAEEVEAFCEAKGLGGGIAHALNLSLDELLANTISYGYDDAAIHAIEVSLSATPGGVTMVIRDDARAFDPTLAPDPDIDAEARRSPDRRPRHPYRPGDDGRDRLSTGRRQKPADLGEALGRVLAHRNGDRRGHYTGDDRGGHGHDPARPGGQQLRA
ncbi:ATP-binding protein [Jiella pelagia]|uniref:ATP-binding protein n=1 Tax=Jiella pelagia TaxID=2986949 RepID=A0ABY7BXX7_9HYPH|nr:ATP-binding protein [Jiella pelagia]WAP67624.1 ATP-binding protein [Jiella pelagia]